MGKRGPRPRKTIDTTWTPGLAYCVGLLATDGCLYNDGRHMSFTSADLQLVRLFKQLLRLPNVVGRKKSGSSEKRCPHIQFGSVLFYDWLMNIGLTPRKSLTLRSLSIPKKYLLDFARGCFDGDGTIYSYMDPRWANSHMFYIAFTSGSRHFTEWLRSILMKAVGIRGHISATDGFYQLRYAKAESIVLITKMYYNLRVPCLHRKRRKILNILKVHRKIQSTNRRIFLKKTGGIEI